jgi:DNA (cytosine-5)-methyltransferase 1
LKVPEATKKGFAEARVGDSINLSVPQSKTRRGRVGKGIAQTLDTGMQQYTLSGNRVRKLMPIECERLMSWPDNHTKYGINAKGETVEISDSQRYIMCGNGVVSEVIKYLIAHVLPCNK